MLEKSYSRNAHAVSAVIAALVLLLFALSYGYASPAYAADATATGTLAAGKMSAGEKGTVTVVSKTATGNYNTMSLETAKGTVHIYPFFYDKAEKFYIWDFGLSSSSDTEDEPTNVSSSNPKVCEASPDYGSVSLSFNKAGKTIVSYNWRGKAHKVTLVVHKWTNPMKSLVVGGRQYASKYKNSNIASAKTKFLTGKVKVKAAKGWKLTSIWGVTGKYGEKKIKNGKTTLKSSDKIRGLMIRFKNKASGQEIWVDLNGKGFYIPL